MTRVYVAGASSELERAERAMSLVRAMPGKKLVHDWVSIIRHHGASIPPDWTSEQKRAEAQRCLEAVRTANLVWLLVPDVPSQGCWVEWGAAYAWAKYLVASGNCGHTLFGHLASPMHETKTYVSGASQLMVHVFDADEMASEAIHRF